MKINQLLRAAVSVMSIGVATVLAQDPIATNPANYKLLSENERVRVIEVTIAPGAEITTHSHPDHSVQVISGGTLQVTNADGKTEELIVTAGQSLFIPAQTHSSKNTGKKPVKAVITELKETAPTPTLTESEKLYLLDILDRGRRDLESMVAKTSEADWNRKPAPGRWSVAEVVEHIALTEPLLLGMVQQALQSPADPNWAAVQTKVAPETLVAMINDRSQKRQAPEPVQPQGKMSRAEAMQAYGSARAVTEEFIRRVDLPIKKHLAQTPLGPMTTHQMLVLLATHNLRHNQQIAEVMQQIKSN
jgi:quercetin dioxygenase-like cupin family protein/uncharacterized damage-inducible protein DinB